MPKQRKKPGSRSIQKRLLIFCEGEKNKSESAYFKALINDYQFPGNTIEVRVVDTNFNTGKELVLFAKSNREFEKDELWVVYDQDGYTKHAQTFDTAKSNNINIAFSSKSFEYWILLHFKKTSKAFKKSSDIVHELKHAHNFDYSKGNQDIYELIKKNLPKARKRAAWIQKYQSKAHYQTKIYKFNPYTDIDKLIISIEKFLGL